MGFDLFNSIFYHSCFLKLNAFIKRNGNDFKLLLIHLNLLTLINLLKVHSTCQVAIQETNSISIHKPVICIPRSMSSSRSVLRINIIRLRTKWIPLVALRRVLIGLTQGIIEPASQLGKVMPWVPRGVFRIDK